MDYTYDAHGNLTSTTSGNINGAAVTYQYDALNRLSKVIDQHRSQALTTTYGYDPIGNLNSVTKPNGEAVTYQYDILNRLTDMTAKVGTNPIANYHYTLGAAGNRTNVAELNGRNVQYTYDDLYRLTGEIISNDPVTQNIGAINYTYDNVGNRQVRTSGIAVVPSQNFSNQYDLNDRLTASGYVYDANGSTTTDPNGTYTYDTLGRMTQAITGSTTTNYVYDGDGNKTSQVVNNGSGSVTTKYLVDTQNPTGYAQVLDEMDGSNTVNKVFTYGTSHIFQDQLINSSWTLSFFGLDGQGSVRYLTDGSGIITDTYDYDAFGTLINQTHISAATPNEFYFDGEQQDGNTGLYNLRARWMNPGIGRFQSMDTYDGNKKNPSSLQKYIFASNNPGNRNDPSGQDDGGISAEPHVFWSNLARDIYNRIFLTVRFYYEYENLSENLGGVKINVEAATKNRTPHYNAYRWVQYVTTNQPKYKDQSVDKEYIDGYRYGKDAPFGVPSTPPFLYSTTEEQRLHMTIFGTQMDDGPGRFLKNPGVGETHWHARTLLVGVDSWAQRSFEKKDVVAQFEWGFEILNSDVLGSGVATVLKEPLVRDQ